ncbi:MAG: serine/threonine protein kinase [Oscillatoriales cyanobacterium]|nr:MAG: serine/threonine protein kinase [Oscillatoriales cyanobacterium]
MDISLVDSFVIHVKQALLPNLHCSSIHPRDPVRVQAFPEPWELVGVGNYAAVFSHPEFPSFVVKVYAPGRPGFEEETLVYERLGKHPRFSQYFYGDKPFLILKRINGVTLYDCVHQGVIIPEQVILDVDSALEYAKQRGLRPHDVHGRNVMMLDGRGVVVDVSDFLHHGSMGKSWGDLRWAYYNIYRPIIARFALPIPYSILNLVRKLYQLIRR